MKRAAFLLALALLGILARPALGQSPAFYASGWKDPKPEHSIRIACGPAYVASGAWTLEATSHVRLGGPHAFGFGCQVDDKHGWKAPNFHALILPEPFYVFPCREAPCSGEWGLRPKNVTVRMPALVTEFGIGLRVYPFDWLSAAFGAGATTVSGCDHSMTGACPMHALHLDASVRASTKVSGDHFRLYAEAGSRPMPPREGRFTTYSEWSGAKHGPGPDAPSTWIWNARLSLGLEFRP